MLQNELINPLKVNKKRVWRWDSSWMWRTCWRWDKWQNARKWSWPSALFEWWQTPLYKRLPKLKWFKNIFKKTYNIVNVWSLNWLEWEVDINVLFEKWLVNSKKWLLKVLWNWDVDTKIFLKTEKISLSAKTKIENAWWKVEILSK
jgi:large subunit ribosomal protein L15